MPVRSPRVSLRVGPVLERAAVALEAGGVHGALNEAEILLGNLLGLSRTTLYAGRQDPVTTYQAAQLGKMVAARCSGRPLQYITGVQGFRGLTLKVGPGVLIPRPETEMLVERCLALLAQMRNPKVVELGTGSGAVALCLAKERPDCRVWGTEISKDAAWWAEKNLDEAGVENVELVRGDLFSALPVPEKGRFNLIVSNPPYLSRRALSMAPPEVREHEPEVALLSGERGTDTCIRIIQDGFDWLCPGGALVMETAGISQWEELKAWMTRRYERVTITPDLAGRPRFAEGWKQ